MHELGLGPAFRVLTQVTMLGAVFAVRAVGNEVARVARFHLETGYRPGQCRKTIRNSALTECVERCVRQQSKMPGSCALANHDGANSVCKLCMTTNQTDDASGWDSWSISPYYMFHDCAGWLQHGMKRSGKYMIYPSKKNYKVAYCDMKTDGGGWTLIQRRFDGSEPFLRSWDEYKFGFGREHREYWLGNEHIHLLTAGGSKYELRIELRDELRKSAVALYQSFSVESEENFYRLNVSGFDDIKSTTGDSFAEYHDGMNFTTYDSDNDNLATGNCALKHMGGWWFNGCLTSHLNGEYLEEQVGAVDMGVIWQSFRGRNVSLMRTEMKIRPAAFGELPSP